MSYDFDSGYYDDGIEARLDADHERGVAANARRATKRPAMSDIVVNTDPTCCRCWRPGKVARDNRLFCVNHWRAEVQDT
jgi:hypothetical protein